MYQFIKNKVLVGVILYLIPFSCSFLIFRLFSFLINHVRSIENAVYAYCIYIILLIFSFAGSYFVARRGKKLRWGFRFLFALIAIFQFLPLIFVIILGAFLIYIDSKVNSKYSKFGCVVTSILAAVTAFSFMIFIVEKGNVKTSRNINKAVYVFNHLSSGDYWIAGILPLFRNFRVMIGANLWDIKLFHWFFNRVGIAIERERDIQAATKREEAVSEAKEFLQFNKRAVVEVFASGTREREPEINGVTGFKRGAFRIACDGGYDVIPMTITNTNKWRTPWKQDTTTKKGKKTSYTKTFFRLMYQFFKTGITPTFVKVIHGNPISSIGKTPDTLCKEVESVIHTTYVLNTKSKKRRKLKK